MEKCATCDCCEVESSDLNFRNVCPGCFWHGKTLGAFIDPKCDDYWCPYYEGEE